jgi:hypothetical protein
MTATTPAFRRASQTPHSRIRTVRPSITSAPRPADYSLGVWRRLIRIASGLPLARWPWHQSRNSMTTTGTRTELQRQHARASLSTARSFWRPICRSRSSLTREDGSWTECIVYAKHSWKKSCTCRAVPARPRPGLRQPTAWVLAVLGGVSPQNLHSGLERSINPTCAECGALPPNSALDRTRYGRPAKSGSVEFQVG